MNNYTIDGSKLYSFIVSGARNLIVNEHGLNKINVFPVADGDTGTNLALTMKTILKKAQKDDHTNTTMSSIAKAAIENAYGNSGMIFAQYLNGLAIEIGSRTQLTQEEFVLATQNAVKYAYEAVSSPKEGTILTVMKEWSSDLKNHVSEEFETLLERSIENAKKTVDNTKFKLKVLMDNNVVDAGAKGFLYFIEGIYQYVKTGILDESHFKAATMEEHVEIIPNTDIGELRYCSQFLVQTEKDKEYFTKLMTPFGDSLVVSKRDEYVQIHIHAKQPEKVMATLVREGTVISSKVDDMQLQANLLHRRKSPIVIVTDSIADFPQEFAEREQITVIPLNLIVDSTVYLDKVTMTPEYFYKHLDDYRMNPTSAQPTQEHLERYLTGLIEQAESVIGIFVSSKMSGTFNNIVRNVNSLNVTKKISLIDSKVNSAAQGLVVMEAAKLRNQGLSHDEIVEKLDVIIKNTHIYVSVKDLKYMIRGGRVSKVQGIILSKLDLKPVISIDETGKGTIFAKTLSQKKAVKQILKKVSNDMREKGIMTYSLVYSDDIAHLNDFKKECKEIIGKDPAYIEAISPIVGLNAGKGAFAIAYIKDSQS